jgi:hypothetical protein
VTREAVTRARLDVARHALSKVEGRSVTAALGWDPARVAEDNAEGAAFPRDVRGSTNEMRGADARCSDTGDQLKRPS